jgi:hypothetical protein
MTVHDPEDGPETVNDLMGRVVGEVIGTITRFCPSL